jgi:phosphopantetheinyl transferase
MAPLTTQVRSHVNRFIRVQEQVPSLVVCINQKSRVHLAYSSGREADLPLIDLPKSKHGKPFIPTSSGQPSESEFSVSHQHPYVGIARVKSIKVGLDIVTFDEINHRLYNDESDFVKYVSIKFCKI